MEALFSYGILAPPTVFITLSLFGALIALRWRRVGIAVALASGVALYVAATPALASYLLARVEAALPAEVDLGKAQAIVVLGGDVRHGDGAAIPDTLGRLSLERVMLAAQAYRRLHLPVVVSGGRVGGAHASEAALMRAALEADFAVPVAWSENEIAHHLGERGRHRAPAAAAKGDDGRAGDATLAFAAGDLGLRAGRVAGAAVAGAAHRAAFPPRRRLPAEHRGAARHLLRAARDRRCGVLPAAPLMKRPAARSGDFGVCWDCCPIAGRSEMRRREQIAEARKLFAHLDNRTTTLAAE